MKAIMRVVQGRPKGKCLRFPNGDFLIGRGVECHVRPNSPWVSRQHCMLRILETGVVIRDLGSANGTLINGTRVIGEQSLKPGDHLQIGPLVLQMVEYFPPPSELVSVKEASDSRVDEASETRADFNIMKDIPKK